MDRLSERLLLISKQVNDKDVICDIGTDHAMIPIYLAKGNLITKAYACDIAEKPLEQAKKNIAKYQVGEIITPILADGLQGLANIKIDSGIISGLGSASILEILQQDSDLIDRYILCSNDDPIILRQWVKEKKYFIEKELLIKENEIIYEIIVINKVVGQKVRNKKDILFGPLLQKEQTKLFQEKWLLKNDYFQTLLNKIPVKTKRYQEIKTKLKMINKVI
ncbi:tRNA (adenine(22)-N(1))-methyltransferase [Spiroplasma endosymbiont of Phyllotreta cruciferae]|uniref:tRNA (adenine(22)-N(1))-methyltransferase n=1 Tax=Spiroplasma endosymbiont of Phyllotreta cruciferae TaxID=2886375 RepID=UPI0020A0C1F4|nr:class I SAM-dependent methyltransferase [Spiroplasma endosymbiont of Phyllotreta cruciferae]